MPSVLANAWKPSSACVVGGRDVSGQPLVLQVRVLGTDARIVEPGRDRMRVGNLTLRVLEQVAESAVQDPGLALRDRGTVVSEL